MENENNLQQADIQPAAQDMDALQKNYKELQAEFTKKSQALRELETKVNSAPSREDIIREYLISSTRETPPVLVSSVTTFDFAKEKKPTSFHEAEALALKYFKN